MTWSECDLQNAPHKSKEILSVWQACHRWSLGKLSIRAASKTYNIPYSTLRGRLTGRVIDGVKSGGPTVLTQEEESKLNQYLVKVADLGAGKTMKQVMEMAYMIAYHDPLRSKLLKSGWLIGVQGKTGIIPLCAATRSLAWEHLRNLASHMPKWPMRPFSTTFMM